MKCHLIAQISLFMHWVPEQKLCVAALWIFFKQQSKWVPKIMILCCSFPKKNLWIKMAILGYWVSHYNVPLQKMQGIIEPKLWAADSDFFKNSTSRRAIFFWCCTKCIKMLHWSHWLHLTVEFFFNFLIVLAFLNI